jgi:hypothetical protein
MAGMIFRGSRRLRMRATQKLHVARANRAWVTQDHTQTELRQRLDNEAKRGFNRPFRLVKRNPGPEGCSVD